VAGHLTLQQMGLRDVLRIALRHPGIHGLNWMIQTSARDKSVLPTDQLIGEIRAMVGSRRHNLGVTAFETLLDIVVHGQDMAVPLGRSLPVPPEVAATAASRAWGYQASWSGRRKAKVFQPLPYAGLRLVATDIDWSVGDGPELRGPVLSLLLMLTGRRVVLPQLEGPGAQTLQRA
jgi:uncharacterized protein (TIGR03083 family)